MATTKGKGLREQASTPAAHMLPANAGCWLIVPLPAAGPCYLGCEQANAAVARGHLPASHHQHRCALRGDGGGLQTPAARPKPENNALAGDCRRAGCVPQRRRAAATAAARLSTRLRLHCMLASAGTIGHVAHGKSTVVKAISGVQTVRERMYPPPPAQLRAAAARGTRGTPHLLTCFLLPCCSSRPRPGSFQERAGAQHYDQAGLRQCKDLQVRRRALPAPRLLQGLWQQQGGLAQV